MSDAGGAFVTQLVQAQRRLYAYILTLVPSLPDADDVLQETNTVLLRKQQEFQPGTHFAAWACRVAYYEVCAHYKRQRRDLLCLPFDERLLERLATAADERYDQQERTLSALEHCLESLSDEDRRLVTLRYRQDSSADQLAEVTGRTPGAVRQVLYRIRKSLLDCVQRRLAEPAQS